MIYHHAVPFSPSSSWLHEYYSPESLQVVKVVKGLQDGWGTCSRRVFFDDDLNALTCWKDLIAVSLCSSDIIILDAVTGTHVFVLHGHDPHVYCLAFSLDGVFLVSGSRDGTIRLWDMQTGGVIKTFCGHTNPVNSISISPDSTTIASGYRNGKISLWDIQTGDCHYIIQECNHQINSIIFSPINPQLLLSATTDHTVQQWDIHGHRIGPAYEGNYVTFSPDGTLFVSWAGAVAMVRNLDSGALVTELHALGDRLKCCCFSPDNKLVVCSDGFRIYAWNITYPVPCCIKTIECTHFITSLKFSSALISSSPGNFIEFWQIDATGPKSTSHPIPITSMCLQASDGIAVSINGEGVVQIWNISTGLCKESFYTSAGPLSQRDIQLIDGKLIFVWCTPKKIHIWSPKEEHCPTVDAISHFSTTRLRISGDGSKVFFLDHKYIKVLSTSTGEVVGQVRLEGELSNNPLIVDGSKVWVCFKDLQPQGWDFGIPGLTPTLLSTIPPNPEVYRLDFVDPTRTQNAGLAKIRNTVTRELVFQLPQRYAKPTAVQWDGRYLAAGYEFEEVLILDFIHMIPQ